MVGGALQERQCAAAVSALSMAAADGDLRDTLPEAAVPIIDVVGLPGILEELVGLEETSLVEQRDSSPASVPGGAHDLFRFSIVGQFIPASTGKQATVTITRRNASHTPSVMKRPGESNGADKMQSWRAAPRLRQPGRCWRASTPGSQPNAPFSEPESLAPQKGRSSREASEFLGFLSTIQQCLPMRGRVRHSSASFTKKGVYMAQEWPADGAGRGSNGKCRFSEDGR